MEALVRVGPVTIGVDSKLFDNYKRGIMSPKVGARTATYYYYHHQPHHHHHHIITTTTIVTTTITIKCAVGD